MKPSRSVTGVEIVSTVAGLRRTVKEWRGQGLTLALIPTMGALHDGHLALVRHGQARCDRAVVSIFVNPTQFGPNEDFANYPRSERSDLDKLAALGTDLVFMPSVEEMYGAGSATTVTVGRITGGLCAKFRPGHFEGVATVVAKLLLQCLPDVAVFGEKDYQQLLVIKRMVKDLAIPVTIEGCSTVRDADGVALSSRNAYLDPHQRRIAAVLNRVLGRIVREVESGGKTIASAREDGLAELKEAGFDKIEYLEICDADSLQPVASLERGARVLAAVHLGKTRLIDNMAITPRGAPA